VMGQTAGAAVRGVILLFQLADQTTK